MTKRTLLTLGLAASLALAMTPQLAATPTNLTSQKILRSGVTPTQYTLITANAGAYSVSLTAGDLLRVKNNDAGQAVTLTFTDQRVNKEGYSTNATLVLAASAIGYAGPFMKNRWADGSGLLQITFAGTTQSATAEAVRLPFGEPEAQTK